MAHVRQVFLGLILILVSVSVLFLYLYLPTVTVKESCTPNTFDVSRIGLIADTHIPDRVEKLPEKVFTVFRQANVDYIIHAGDITSFNVIRKLKTLAPVIAVHGNHDPPLLCQKYPEINFLTLGDRKIGVWHNPNYLFRTRKMRQLAKKRNFDVFVVGHSHKQAFFVKDGRYYVNPGSPTFPLPPFLVKPTVAILTLTSPPHVSFIEV